MSQFQEAPSASIKYGELIVLGFNGFLPNGDDARMKRRFTLCQRPEANGVKPSTVQVGCNPQSEAIRLVRLSAQHRITYASTVVEYAPDRNTDMFQIGRSLTSPNDFVVTDTVPGCPPEVSKISRFACRIVCQRSPPYTARIYAAGFNDSNNIFLGENAVTWKKAGQMDGLTTNGVLVMHPPSNASEPGKWREISVCGNVFKLREELNLFKIRGNSGSLPGKMKNGESHELVNGSLIDLCGVTLMWFNPPPAAPGRGPGPQAHLEVQPPGRHTKWPCIVHKKDGACVLDPQRAAAHARPGYNRWAVLDQIRSGGTPLSVNSRVTASMLRVIQKTREANDVCKLTLDPNTAHKKISLSANNRKVTRVEVEQRFPEHPDRFKDFGQVMSIESLTGLCYWEVEWSGEVEIAVTYKGIDRQEDDSQFGCNDKSWSLKCSGGDDSYTVWHNTTKTDLAVSPSSHSGRVAVYVDWHAGTVSFCTVSSGTLTHLHTFQTKFTEYLYAGFWVGWSNSSVSVCQREEVQ